MYAERSSLRSNIPEPGFCRHALFLRYADLPKYYGSSGINKIEIYWEMCPDPLF